MATPKPQGGLPTSITKAKPMYGEATDADDAVETAMQRVMDAYAKRQERDYDPGLMAIAQGLLSSTGNFGSAAGAAAKNYQDVQAQLKQEEIDTATAELQLSQATRDQALMRKKMQAGAGLFSGTSGGGAADEGVDQDAVSLLVQSGIPRKEAVGFLVQGGISPAQKVSGTGFDMSAGLKKYGEYVSLYGNDDQAKGFLEALKLQNDRYALQNGMRMDKASGRVEFVQAEGLPAQGEKNIEMFIGGGTRKVDQRTAILYEFAQNQGPEVAKDFAEKYLKNGTVPKDIVDKYKAQQSGAAGPTSGAEIPPERLNSILTALEMKSTAFGSPVELVGEKAGQKFALDKNVKFNPQEAQVMAAMFRIGNAQVNGVKEEDLKPFDRQVLAAFRARAKPPVELAPPSDVEKAAAAPAAVKVAAAAPPAPPPAPAAPPAAAAVPAKAAPAAAVPAAKVAEAPAKAAAAPAAVVSSSAAAPAGVRPAPPKIISVPPLKANASLEDQKSQEALRTNAEAANRAEIERYKIEMEQFNKNENRPKDVEAGIEEAGRKKRAELAEVVESDFLKSLTPSRQLKGSSLRVRKYLTDTPNAVGLLADPGFFNAVGKLVVGGFSVGETTVRITDAEDALALMMPGLTKDDIKNRALIGKDLAEIELVFTREYLSGDGAITEGERKIAQRLGGVVADNIDVLLQRMDLITAKSKYKEEKINAFQEWRSNKNNDKLSINDWLASKEAKRIDKDFDKKTDALYTKFFGGPAKTTSSGEAVVPQFKGAKDELDAIMKGKK
jgi:hypothetical protein